MTPKAAPVQGWAGLVPLCWRSSAGCLRCPAWAGGLAPDQLLMTNPNGDSIWTFSLGYICRNLPATAKLLLRTIPAQGALWLQGILGTTLGEPIVYRIDVSWLLGVGLVLALLAAALPVQDEPDEPLLGRRTGFGVLGIILCVAVASLVVARTGRPSTMKRCSVCRAATGCPCCRWRFCSSRETAAFVRGATFPAGRHWPSPPVHC